MTTPGRRVRLLHEHVGLGLVTRSRPQGVAPQPRFLRDRSWLVALDTGLTPVGHVPVPYEPGQELLTATPDLGLVVTSGPYGTELHRGGAFRRLPLVGADGAALLPGGLLLVTRPGSVGHEAFLVHLRDDTVLDRVELDCEDASAVLVPHPRDGSVLVDLGEGEDGSRLYALRAVAGKLVVRELPADTSPGGFAPSGDRLLVLPHPSFATQARLESWPDGELLAELDRDGGFDALGCVLDESTAVLLGLDDRVIVTDGALHHPQELDLPGDLTGLLGLAPGLFATEHEVGDVVTTRVWRLSPP